MTSRAWDFVRSAKGPVAAGDVALRLQHEVVAVDAGLAVAGDEVGGHAARKGIDVTVGMHRENLAWVGRFGERPPIVVVEPRVGELLEERIAEEEIGTIEVFRESVPLRGIARACAPEVVTVCGLASAIKRSRRPFDSHPESRYCSLAPTVPAEVDKPADKLVPAIGAHTRVAVEGKRFNPTFEKRVRLLE